MTIVEQAVAIGLIIGLFLGELFGVTPGMVVPGYVGLQVSSPERVAGTILVAIAVVLVVRGISQFTLLHGRRRFLMMVIVGFAMGLGFRQFLTTDVAGTHPEFRVVGIIVPGILGHWMDRQGMIVTAASLVVAAVLVRLLLIAVFGSGPGF
ncbi:MAG TPA: poly-gamma-glutamate biosynthesis protein PgsC [Dehalococcoidia bacterium]|nr:poly-gamma-glutamate biosynthesis protein PgsC [Dehalococcoidia bacterium]